MCKALTWSSYLLTTLAPAVALVLALHFFNMATATIGMSPAQTLAALRTLLEGPAMSPPAGVVPDFDNPANLDNYATVCNALSIAFPTLAVVLRMYTKVFILRVLAWEDCGFRFLSYDVTAVNLLSPLRCHHPCMGKVHCGKWPLFY